MARHYSSSANITHQRTRLATYKFSTADISIFNARFTADVAPSEVHRIGHDVASQEGNGEGEYCGELHLVVLVQSSSCAIEGWC